MTRRRPSDQDGTVVAMLGVVLAALGLVTVLIVDVAAYLAAASRAQAAADAGALAAAAATDPRTGASRDPTASVEQVVAVTGARLERCECRSGGGRVTVHVSVPVPALVVTRLAARRVTATASAEVRLVPPEP